MQSVCHKNNCNLTLTHVQNMKSNSVTCNRQHLGDSEHIQNTDTLKTIFPWLTVPKPKHNAPRRAGIKTSTLWQINKRQHHLCFKRIFQAAVDKKPSLLKNYPMLYKRNVQTTHNLNDPAGRPVFFPPYYYR